MITLLLTVAIFMLAVMGLGIGIMFQRPQLKGSCGGCGECLCQRKKS